MERDRTSESFRQNNRLIVALVPQSLENILLKAAIRIEPSFRSITCIRVAYFAQPFFVSRRGCLAERPIGRGVSMSEAGKPGQRLERFPRVKAHCGIRIAQTVDEIGIK